MRILHIASLASTRVLKQVIAQQNLPDHEVALMCRGTGHPGLMARVTLNTGIGSETSISHWLSWADLVHAHSTIADADQLQQLNTACRRAGVPIVWDIHDWPEGCKEKQKLSQVAGVVVPSRGYCDRLSHKNTAVVYSKVPKVLMPPTTERERLPYTALVSLVADTPIWRDYRPARDALEGKVHLFSPVSNSGLSSEWKVFEKTPYVPLLHKLTEYEWNWCDSANPLHHIHDCVTNKFWDGLAAGCKPRFEWGHAREMQAMAEDPGDLQMESELSKLEMVYNAV